MPIRQGKDKDGCYWVYGNQKKYHYECGNEQASKTAKQKAEKQAAAIHISKEAQNSLRFYIYYDN